jgi:hypothetical protein
MQLFITAPEKKRAGIIPARFSHRWDAESVDSDLRAVAPAAHDAADRLKTWGADTRLFSSLMRFSFKCPTMRANQQLRTKRLGDMELVQVGWVPAGADREAFPRAVLPF